MSDPDRFRVLWNEDAERADLSPLVAFPSNRLHEDRLRARDRLFLEEIGLPASAAPLLSFAPDTLEWMSAERRPALYKDYIGIGSDGEGSPLVASSQGVFLLDHDDGFAARIINSTVQDLAYMLLFFQEFVTTINATQADPTRIRAAMDILIGKIKEQDQTTEADGSWWMEQVEMFAELHLQPQERMT